MRKASVLSILVACVAAQCMAKGTLILQVGSDWCVSGEDVRKAFESKEFSRSKIAQQYSTAIYDDMDNPTPAVKSKNDSISAMVVRTKRFPAITCYTDSKKIFAQIENIPNNVTGEKLAKAIARQTKRKDEAEALFKKAEKASGEEAADLIGQGFDILASMMGPFHFKELTDGKFAWTREWDTLVKLDAGDKYGWLAHFRMDEYETVRMVEQVTTLKADGYAGKAQAYVETAKAIPQKHFTANQKQCIKIMEYALNSQGSGGMLSSANKKLMKEVFDLGRDTLWGQFAMGRLMMDGEKIESKGLYHAKVVPRPTNSGSVSTQPMPIDKYKSVIKTIKPGDQLKEEQKLAIARYAAMRLIGPKGWQKLMARPGSAQFVKAFFSDREWMEDFAWSGTFPVNSTDAWCESTTEPGYGEGAILALESLIFQDKGRWCEFENGKYENNEGRRFMTALAINFPDKDEAWLADVLDAYRTTALSGRLHKAAYDQSVWLWRFATHQGHATGGCDNMAAQQRHLDKFVNVPQREYGGLPWMITYRLKNCFGDSVHGPLYYKAWSTAGEWPKRKYSQIVGGVCGELSKFGSACSNAHGYPSTTVGQPGHCAYSRRLTDGTWEIDYSVTGHSQMHLCFWNRHEWQYSSVLETTYSANREDRLAAERQLTLAALAEELKKDDKTIEKYYQHACAALPGHYGAWNEYGSWLMRSEKPLDKIRVWVRGCARGMKAGRQPLWNILTPYFERVAKEKGKESLRDDLIDFAKNLKQTGPRLQEEADFKTVLDKWGELLGNDKQMRYDVLKAMLSAQLGTSDYFSQTMGWGSDYFSTSADGVATFNKCLSEALAQAEDTKGKGKKGAQAAQQNIDFKPLILSASKNGNIGAFRQMVKLQQKLSPNAPQGALYPKSDFGGELLSSEGLLQTSSTCGYDKPDRYPLAIDSSPCEGGAAFHTDTEESPWAIVMLPGPTILSGVLIENRAGGVNGSRQVPLVVEVSDDGKSWQSVYEDGEKKDTYRVNLSGRNMRAQYVRVSRKAGVRKDFFHLNKILVYGKKLW